MKIVRMISADGLILKRWPKVRDAADDVGMSHGNMSMRIQRGTVINGVKFERIETDDVPEEWKKPRKIKRRTGVPVCQPKSVKKKKPLHEVHYETKDGVVCITPCPFKADEPRIKVGSNRCSRCHSFKKKDKEKHIVFCSFLMFGYRTQR